LAGKKEGALLTRKEKKTGPRKKSEYSQPARPGDDAGGEK